MEYFLLWPIDTVAIVLAAGAGLLLLAAAVAAWRNPLLLRLGLRNILRRKLRALLIVFGLMLSTTVIGSAFGTGDTMTHTVHSLVAGGIGSVDQIIVRDPPRDSLKEKLKQLSEPGYGGLAAAELSFFSQDERARLAQATRKSAVVEGLLPAILDQVTLIHDRSQQLQLGMPLLAVGTSDVESPAATSATLHAADGSAIALADIADNSVVINQAGADAFGAVAGETLTIVRGSQSWHLRIAAVAQNRGLAGGNPLLLLPLERYQRTVDRMQEINLLLVTNQGDSTGTRITEQASSELRSTLADQQVARQLHAAFSQPDLQRALLQFEGLLHGRERDALAALRAEAARAEPSERFISLLSAPRTRQRLLSITARLPDQHEHRELHGLLRELTSLTVLDIKREALEQAQQSGAVITSIFLVLGVFSIAGSIILIFLIFALLAADRGAELATMRALGMRRRQIRTIFLFEGLVYNVLGSLLGTLASLTTTYAFSRLLAQNLAVFGLHFSRHIEPRTLVVTFTAGLLLTFAAMYLAGWRASRMQIIAATRGAFSADNWRWLYAAGVALLLLAGAIWWRWSEPAVPYAPRHPLVLPAAVSLALQGVVCWLLPLQHIYQGRLAGKLAAGLETLAEAGAAGIWLYTIAQLPTPHGEIQADALTSVIGVIVLVLMAVRVVTRLLGPLARALDWALAGLTRLRVIVRPAVGYLSSERWRAGLTLLLFTMVICSVVSALTLVHVLLTAFIDDEPSVAGFELRADFRREPPRGSLTRALDDARATSADTFRAIGGVSRESARAIQLGLPQERWHASRLMIADDGFLRSIKATIARRAPGYDTSSRVWSALDTHRGTAVVTGRGLNNILSLNQQQTGKQLEPVTLWVRPGDGGQAIKLRVIGIVDARSELDSGIYVSQETAQALGIQLEPPRTFFLAVGSGIRVKDAAAGLRISFAQQDVTVTNLGDLLRIGQTIRLLLTRLVQGFMGLGLIAGIAALGLLGIQAVHERRQQIGMLRALGFTRRQTRRALTFESSLIALLGVSLGVALGLVLAHSVVSIAAARYPEVLYLIPWSDITVTIAMACLGSYAAIVLAAIQAGRVTPAEALRTT